MAICKIGGLLLRHFSIVFNVTTATAAVRSRFVCREIASNFNKTLKQSKKKLSFNLRTIIYMCSQTILKQINKG